MYYISGLYRTLFPAYSELVFEFCHKNNPRGNLERFVWLEVKNHLDVINEDMSIEKNTSPKLQEKDWNLDVLFAKMWVFHKTLPINLFHKFSFFFIQDYWYFSWSGF